ncbi:MAG: porin, partial [Deltaproteobacteria bacterium]|nr:porin [Deltaproteobacteria bacterium]
MKRLSLKGVLFCGFFFSEGLLEASPVSVTYDDGTVLEVSDTGFKNKINIGLKAGYTYSALNYRDADNEEESSFDVGLARLQLSGHSGSKEIGYEIQADFAQPGLNQDNEFKLANAYAWWSPSDWVKVKLGQMKQGFPAQFMVDDFSSQFYVRDSLATRYYNLGRNQGIVLGIKDPDKTFHLHFGVYNGESQYSFADGGIEGQNHPGADTDHRFIVAGRYNILGNVDWKSESDYDMSEEVNWSVTAGYSFATNNYSAIGIPEAPPLEYDIDFQDVAFGTQVRYAGFSFNAEGFWRDWDPQIEKGDDGWGYYVQAGAFLNEDIEVFGRFSGVDCKAYSLTSDVKYCVWSDWEDVYEYSIGTAYHFGSPYRRAGIE